MPPRPACQHGVRFVPAEMASRTLCSREAATPCDATLLRSLRERCEAANLGGSSRVCLGGDCPQGTRQRVVSIAHDADHCGHAVRASPAFWVIYRVPASTPAGLAGAAAVAVPALTTASRSLRGWGVPVRKSKLPGRGNASARDASARTPAASETPARSSSLIRLAASLTARKCVSGFEILHFFSPL